MNYPRLLNCSFLIRAMTSTVGITLISGCSGFGGSIAAGALSGALAGEGARSLFHTEYWPFDSAPLVISVECEGRSFEIEASWNFAHVTQDGEEKFFSRSSESIKEKSFDYWYVASVPVDELGVTEGMSHGESKSVWLHVSEEKEVQLKIDEASIQCNDYQDNEDRVGLTKSPL